MWAITMLAITLYAEGWVERRKGQRGHNYIGQGAEWWSESCRYNMFVVSNYQNQGRTIHVRMRRSERAVLHSMAVDITHARTHMQMHLHV